MREIVITLFTLFVAGIYLKIRAGMRRRVKAEPPESELDRAAAAFIAGDGRPADAVLALGSDVRDGASELAQRVAEGELPLRAAALQLRQAHPDLSKVMSERLVGFLVHVKRAEQNHA